ncbi:FAD-dependent oxidoreductase [Lentzea flaviverrucosa]|uniref:2-polyprenyl-6-methoxyphenol hydroxylase n=1 Tax=Lentzea flaviverrucosa TaxID=200379 RepID=A0A1H9XRL3_9PSEU|nr:NAD(P)/FAD-dependent oxidoreductase [Lentzea flaviverrucosa]RDI19824.1 2-polyprenyl-6-methoxyphenol hydroxylase-like FAD-dependent oxidoreductase [Lentzea flaviverrucosa]SES48447.1 2-polyprenyl-6-methoxyphenol hydroxylase [Lentzea flaviverrucosa]
MRVLIIGAGTGGLCLAHGLKKAGVDVALFERDRTPRSMLIGYRVGISPDGSRALHSCLPPDVFAEFVRTTARPPKHIVMRTEKYGELLVGEVDTDRDASRSEKSVSRIAMRTALLGGLDDVVRFDKTFTRFAQNDDGTVTAFFDDGTSETGDVLVGADGAQSRVRRQYLPDAKVVDTGITSIAGKLPLTEENAKLLPPLADGGITLLFGTRGEFVIIHVMRFDGTGVEDDYIMWGYAASHDKFPDMKDMSQSELKQVVLNLTPKFHPHLRKLFALATPETVFQIRVRTSERLRPWQPSNVTMIGDSVHLMTPGRGIGANTALRDAELLCRKLTEGEDAVRAIGEYEREMIEYGFQAVESSREMMNGSSLVHKPVIGRVAAVFQRTFLRVTNAVPVLKRRMLAEDAAERDHVSSDHEVVHAR